MTAMPRHIRLIITFDLIACALFALPWLSQQVINVINTLNASLGLGGEGIVIPAAAFFFVNFGGVLGVALNVMLLKTDNAAMHMVNIYARTLVVALLIYYIIARGLPQLLGVFVFTEALGGLASLPWIRNMARHAG
jgi:hypothetical protein